MLVLCRSVHSIYINTRVIKAKQEEFEFDEE